MGNIKHERALLPPANTAVQNFGKPRKNITRSKRGVISRNFEIPI